MRRTILILLVAAVLLPGCAVFEEDNRMLTSALDDAVEPESTGAKIALSPVFIPVGVASIVVDAVVIHPISEIPNAADDTYELVWEDPEGSYVTQTFLLAPKLVVTPVVFVFTWLGRSMFDI
jgi:hypothetical protein